MNKTKSMRVRLTDEEWQQAESASLALFSNKNKSQLIRKLLRDYVGMGPDLTAYELKEFREAVRQLTGIARNLNQITSRVNSEAGQTNHLSLPYIDAIKIHVNDVNNSLKNHIKRTVKRYQDVVNYGE